MKKRTKKNAHNNIPHINRKHKFDWILFFAFTGWGAIVIIWVFQSIKYFVRNEIVWGVVYLIVAMAFLLIGSKSVRDYLDKKKK